MTKLHDFSHLVSHWLHKVGWLLRFTAQMDLPWVFQHMYTSQNKTGSVQKVSFLRAFFDGISEISIPRKLCIILNWLSFENHHKTHLPISV